MINLYPCTYEFAHPLHMSLHTQVNPIKLNKYCYVDMMYVRFNDFLSLIMYYRAFRRRTASSSHRCR